MIVTYQDEIGWVAWDTWNMKIFGQGDYEKEAVADLNMQWERIKIHQERLKSWQNS